MFLTGCNDPKIDTTSEETTKTSIQKVKESLKPEKQKEFEDSLKILMFSKINFKDILARGQNAVGGFQEDVKVLLNGKTAEQVISEANRVKAERAEKEQKQAIEEIKELEEKQQKALQSVEELKKFEVLRSHFEHIPQKYGPTKPIIELTVKNGTSKAISRVYFVGTIASKGREIPWHKDEFNYQIAGGLEPNETGVWSLAPNMFSGWGKVDAPADAIFTVVVERIDGADGKPIFSTKDFTDKNLERLTELKKKYSVR